MKPVERWSAEEREKRNLLEQSIAVAENLHRHHDLIAWAKERGLLVRVDRATAWGNPFVLGRDGDRATVIARHCDDYVPFQPGLLSRVGGVALQGARLLVRSAGVSRRRAHPGACAARGWSS
jgi:hypothetical protein